MAHIAEDLLLLLLDNASAQPIFGRNQLGRVLAAAVLLDLAYDCRVRPASPAEPAPPGYLIALVGPPPTNPVVRSALTLLEQGPIAPASAIAKLSKRTEGNAFDQVVDQLLRTGQVRQIQLKASKFRRNEYAWPINDRARLDAARSAVLAALFDHQHPDPPTAAIIALLHLSEGLGTLLNLNDRGLEWVYRRAGEIASGSWVDSTKVADINLAVTIAALQPALT